MPCPTGAVPHPTGAVPRPTGAVPRQTGAVPRPTNQQRFHCAANFGANVSKQCVVLI